MQGKEPKQSKQSADPTKSKNSGHQPYKSGLSSWSVQSRLLSDVEVGQGSSCMWYPSAPEVVFGILFSALLFSLLNVTVSCCAASLTFPLLLLTVDEACQIRDRPWVLAGSGRNKRAWPVILLANDARFV